MKKELQIAAQLLKIAKGKLVIRGLSDYVSGEFPHIGWQRRISIYLLSFCKAQRGAHEGFFEVYYGSEDDPVRWYKPSRFRVESLHASVEFLDDNVVNEQTAAVWERFSEWNSLWVASDEVVICNKDNKGNLSMLPPSCFRFMLHFTRLHGLLMEYGATTTSSWMVDDLIRRLGRFLKERTMEWERVIG